MKYKFLSAIFCAFLIAGTNGIYAAGNYPDGDITFYNASNKKITAAVSSGGSFNLSSNEQRNVSYRLLATACSSSPTNCKAQFYADNKPAGTATINTTTGKLVSMNLAMKVKTGKSEQILRSVIIK